MFELFYKGGFVPVHLVRLIDSFCTCLFAPSFFLHFDKSAQVLQDPFLCSSSGFCKYARLESSVICRPLPAVQQIEDDESRKAVRLAANHFNYLLLLAKKSILLNFRHFLSLSSCIAL